MAVAMHIQLTFVLNGTLKMTKTETMGMNFEVWFLVCGYNPLTWFNNNNKNIIVFTSFQ